MMNDQTEEETKPQAIDEHADSTAVRPSEPLSLSQAFGGTSPLRALLETILLAAVLFMVINVTTGRFQVHGSCMEPTLHTGQYVIVSKMVYWFHPPERGDVIVLQPPGGQEEDYIKRVIGLPGEAIEIRDGVVWVDGLVIDEPYVATPPAYTGAWRLGENQYLVLGDSRNNANDSHTWGALPEENIIGKAWLSYWPPEEWGLIDHYAFQEEIGKEMY